LSIGRLGSEELCHLALVEELIIVRRESETTRCSTSLVKMRKRTEISQSSRF
jgi:hypothetical protein